MIASVHLSPPELQAKVRDLTKSLSLKESTPSQPLPPPPAPPSAASPEVILTVDSLQEMEERQKWLEVALNGVVANDSDLENIRSKRRLLEARQQKLETELQQRRILEQQNGRSEVKQPLQAAPCRRCQNLEAAQKGLNDRERTLNDRRQQLQLQETLLARESDRMETERRALERKRRETLALQQQLEACRAALEWERRQHEALGTSADNSNDNSPKLCRFLCFTC